ncbi:ATP-binding protein [Alteribacillus iranensis]|uniref:Uncharacterized protein YhaN n=1 Tax=Alteribacillus iranensis TaxID=930128 RepID=A0A1I1Z7A2_9BACI|nr:AAA family ATPase [Alteribacillus iranensis]SFE26363.1 Uncharacterized protein YhaN [Alteribacillus iranensis]
MRIEKIHIHGFGKLIHTTIRMESTLHFIVGENEAGKSTIRAFIQAVLFGFPTRKEKLLRYEPKHSSNYGGSITIRMDDGREVMIERILKSKAAGDVTVTLDNGEIHGEEWLHVQLGKMDRHTYQGIFSFGVDGIQALHELKGEELNQYIYEAGVTGTRELARLEKELADRTDQLFRPKGKKPIINSKVKHVHQRVLEVKSWERNFEKYNQLLEEKEQINQQLKKLLVEKRVTEQKKEKIQRKKVFRQLLNDKEKVEKQLQQILMLPLFTEDAEKTWRQYTKRKEDAEFEWNDIELDIWKISARYQGVSVNWPKYTNTDKSYALKEKTLLYQSLREDIIRVNDDIAKRKMEADAWLKRINGDKMTLANADTSLQSEEELKAIEERGKDIRDKMRALEEQKNQEERELQQMQAEVNELESEVRPEKERLQRKELIEKHNQSSHSKGTLYLLLITAILLSIGSWEIVMGNQLRGVIILIAGVISFVVNRMKVEANKKTFVHKRESILHEQEMEEEERVIHRLKEVQWQMKRTSRKIIMMEETLEREIQNWIQIEKELEDWRQLYKFPALPSYQSVEYYFHQVKKWQDMNHKVYTLHYDIKSKKNMLHRIEAEVEELADVLKIPVKSSVEETIRDIHETCKAEVRLNDDTLEDASTIHYLYDQKSGLEQTMIHANDHIHRIYNHFHINTREEAERAIEARYEYENCQQKLEWLNEQIKAQLLPGESEREWKEEMKRIEDDWSINESEEIDKKEEELHKTFAKVGQEIEKLEKDGTYEDILQQVEEEKADLQDNIHEWLALTTAKQMINRAKSVYEKEKQPYVIRKASEYFSYITSGEGRRLLVPAGKDQLIIEYGNGDRFTPEELSRGTAEQLYLSLRLALAESFTRAEGFPLIMDDPFVNFDSTRRHQAFSLINQLTKNRQVIYFTCHEVPDFLKSPHNVSFLQG